MKNLIKAQIKYNLSAVHLFTALIFILFVFANFFIRQQFFNGNLTNLSILFNSIPYIGILIFPVLCYKKNTFEYYDFIPYSSFQKIIADFSADLIFYTAFLLLLLPAILCTALFCTMELSQLFTSYLFLIFYGAASIALCIFIYSVCSNQIFAFLVSAIILAFFNYSHNFSLYLGSKDFLSSIFKNLSFAWHFDDASKGILDTRDLLFFILISVLFILLTVYFHEKKIGKNYKKNQITFIRLLFLMIFLLFLNSSRFYLRFDLSKNKTFSTGKYTSSLIKNLNGPLNITFYRSKILTRLYPQVKDVTDFLQNFAFLNKNVNFKMVNPDSDEKIQQLLQTYGIQSQQLKTSNLTQTQLINVYSSIVIEYEGIFKVIPFTLSAQTLEYNLCVRIKEMVSGQSLKANVIVGNGMNFSEDYSYVPPFLAAAGISCNPIFPQDPYFIQQLENTSGPLLVIGDSKITIENAIAIENYLLSQKGGALLNISPYSADISGTWSLSENQNTNLVEMAENWGIKFNQGITADISCSRITMVSEDSQSATGEAYSQVINYPMWVKVLPQKNIKSEITLFWPCSLSLENPETAFAGTTNMGWIYPAEGHGSNLKINTNPMELNEQGFSVFSKQELPVIAFINKTEKGLYNLAEGNIKALIVPDQYFLNTLMTGYNNDGESVNYNNFDFAISALLELSGNSELNQLYSKDSRSSLVFRDSDGSIFIKKVIFTLVFLFAAYPCLLIAIYFIYRKNQFNLLKEQYEK